MDNAPVYFTIFLACLLLWAMLSTSLVRLNVFFPDYVFHIIGFALLTFPCAIFRRKSLTFMIPLILAFSVSKELIQGFVGRDAEIRDVIFDGLGVALAVVVGRLIGFLLRRFL